MPFYKLVILITLIVITFLETLSLEEMPHPHIEQESSTRVVYMTTAKKYIPIEYAEKMAIVL